MEAAAGEVRWDAPLPGQWYLTREHFPRPVSRLFAELFPPTTLGWQTSALRYGLPAREPRWAAVNCWLYYSPGRGGAGDGTEAAAAETLRTARWRDDIRAWHEADRPRVIAANLALQAEVVTGMDDAALAEHLRRTIDHFLDVGRLHFELHTTFSVAGGLVMEACAPWGIGPGELAPLLSGASPASAAARQHIDRIVDGLGDRPAASLDDIRAAGPAASAALDAYLAEYGWRCLDQHELRGATLIERPDVIVAAVRARVAGVGGAPATTAPDAVRRRVPEGDRDRFDELLSELRAAYGLNDDNVGITWGWPLGLVRRAVLEAGRRLAEGGAVGAADDLFEADRDELLALLRGDGPTASELAARAERYRDASDLDPPAVIGRPEPEGDRREMSPSVARLAAAEGRLWGSGPPAPAEPLCGLGIGDTAYRGRACVIDGDGYLDLEPGDVIVATITHAGHNTVFPVAGAVATEHGGLLSHPAVLARELGLPAVVSVNGLLARVRTGQSVEVDPIAGVVRLLD